MIETQASFVGESQLRRLRAVPVLESCTLLLLIFVAVPLKHIAGWNTGVRILGPVHGLAFIVYVWTVLVCAAEAHWSRVATIRSILIAFVPFGGFANLRYPHQKGSSRGVGRAAQ